MNTLYTELSTELVSQINILLANDQFIVLVGVLMGISVGLRLWNKFI